MRHTTIPALLMILGSLPAQGIQLPPPGLQAGQPYRVLLVTDGTRNATSPNISDYDAFVTAEATASAPLAALGTSWRAVASTPTVDAQTHTETAGSAAAPGVPIYRPDGVRIADDYLALWNATSVPLLAPPAVSATGVLGPLAWRAWTGTGASGTPFPGESLGETGGRSWAGTPGAANRVWMGSSNLPQTNVHRLYGISDVVVVPLMGSVTNLGGSCSTPSRAFLFTPNANGGYDAAFAGSNAYDPVVGTLAGATSNNNITATGIDLGFPFPWPTNTGTAPEQLVRIDPNGRILPDSSGATTGVASPSIPWLSQAGYPLIAPFWVDWNPASSQSDGIYFKSGPGIATFTWRNVVQSNSGNGGTPMTVQCALHANGDVLVVLEDIEGFNRNGQNDNCCIGISTGVWTGPSNPPQIDLPALAAGGPTQSSALPIFESFPHRANFPLHIKTPSLVAKTSPIAGNAFTLQVQNVDPAATSGLYLVGLAAYPTPIDTTPYGFPCQLIANPLVTVPVLADGLGNLAELPVPLPSGYETIGTPIVAQGATNGAPYPTPLFLTNALSAVIGSY